MSGEFVSRRRARVVASVESERMKRFREWCLAVIQEAEETTQALERGQEAKAS